MLWNAYLKPELSLGSFLRLPHQAENTQFLPSACPGRGSGLGALSCYFALPVILLGRYCDLSYRFGTWGWKRLNVAFTYRLLTQSWLCIWLSVVFLAQWLSNFRQHQGVPGELIINADSLGLPGRDASSFRSPGGAWSLGSSSKSQRDLPLVIRLYLGMYVWSCRLPWLVGTDHPPGFWRSCGTQRSWMLTGKTYESQWGLL